MSRNKNALKDVLDNKESEARERGLIVNENKTKYMEVTRTVVNGNHLQWGKYEFEPVKKPSYLGSQLNQTNSTNCEIQAKIISGNRCYYSCGALMKSRALNRSSKLKYIKLNKTCSNIRMWDLDISKSKWTTIKNIWAENIQENFWPSTRWKWNLETQKEPWTEWTYRKCRHSKIYKKQKNGLARTRDADGWRENA